jgi:hypothetical protein
MTAGRTLLLVTVHLVADCSGLTGGQSNATETMGTASPSPQSTPAEPAPEDEPTPCATFVVDTLTTNVTLQRGETVRADVVLRNDGDAPGAQQIRLRSGRETITTFNVSLGTGESHEVRLLVPTTDSTPAEYTVTAETATDSASATVTASPADSVPPSNSGAVPA